MEGKLQVRNDWEAYRYSVNGKDIDPAQIKEVTINGTKYPVVTKRYQVSYSDMGHTYNAERTDLIVQLTTELGHTTDCSLMGLHKQYDVMVEIPENVAG